MATKFYFDPIFVKHEAGPGHPERPQRLTAILKGLEDSGLMPNLGTTVPKPASPETIEMVHAKKYIEHIAAQSATGQPFYEDADTGGCAATYEAALKAAGAVCDACDAVMSGDSPNAFCAARPPGHHAEFMHAMGFCFFNNVAIGARWLQKNHGIERVSILDWDVHHGNGTQNTFYDDPTVQYLSMHQYPHYPGSGTHDQTGTGEAKGSTINYPMAMGSTDHDYLEAMKGSLIPAIKTFSPGFIIISAGFDAHMRDPLSGTHVSTDCFAEMTRMLMDCASEICQGRIVSVLEGGYDLKALATAVPAHIQVLAGV